jgi:hypothetical protein
MRCLYGGAVNLVGNIFIEAVSKPSIAFKIVAKKRSTLRNMPILRIDRFDSTKSFDIGFERSRIFLRDK